MINFDKEKYQGATADKINSYNWVLKDEILDSLDSNAQISLILSHNFSNIWDPLALKLYLHESI